jgi:putative oxidoreductase
LRFAPFLLLLVRVSVGGIFVVSGLEKLGGPAVNFALVIEKYEILGGGFPAMALAQTLPWAELIAGVFLVLGLRTRGALFVLWTMNTVFIGVLISALWRKLPIEECGCFGGALSRPLPQILALDLTLWVLFLVYFLASNRVKVPSLDAWIDHD